MFTSVRPVWAILLLYSGTSAAAAEPLHHRIDKHITAKFGELAPHVAPRTGDEEFARRLTLDLTGTLPTVREVNEFLADTTADKREKLVDRLLASPGYARRMAWHFDALFTEPGKDQKVPRAAWEAYLRVVFAENRPFDAFVREVLSADGVDPKTRPAAKFLLDRDLEPHTVTRDIARILLGRDMKCAQCHDHPTIGDYKQAEFYGIQAFLNRSYLFPNPGAANAVIAEKAEGDVNFMSVFDKSKTLHGAVPRMPGGKPVDIPKTEKGKEYKIAPAPNVRPVPTVSRRAMLAEAVTSPDNPAFARTAVNRVWAMMTGRGIVHPVDLDHADNPPSHPELLEELTTEFVAHKYDLKWLVREIALSVTYQRSSEAPAASPSLPAEKFLVAVPRPLTAEQLAYAVMQATGLPDAERMALGAKATEAELDKRLVPRIEPFRSAFGRTSDTGGFAPTLGQTLFVKHGAVVRGMLPPRAGNLTDRLGKLTNPDAIADELFASVLSRRPTPDERKDIADALAAATDRKASLAELVWALLASAEFRFNH